jgi:hypothetical protein
VLKPLFLVLGVIVVAGALMLGGWALTNGTPAAPVRPAPAAGAGADHKRDSTSASRARSGATGRQAGRAAPVSGRAQAGAILDNTAKAGLAQAPAARPSNDGPGDDDSERARRNSTAQVQRLREEQARKVEERRRAEAEQARQAEERRQADTARRAAERQRAEQARLAEAARQTEAARRAGANPAAGEPDEQRTHDGIED